ncbi:hypothetical protein Vafri_3668, partial [Volvox africanus]
LPRRGLLRTSLALGSVLSCTDSVAALQLLHKDRERVPLLYSLLFGEGVVNDATAIVLLGAITNLPYGSDEEDNLSPGALGRLALRFSRLFALSTALGLGVGLLSASIVRWFLRRPGGSGGPGGVRPCRLQPQNSNPDMEVLAVALLGLLAYFLAEALELSAVLSVFFCGIAMSHYTWHNLLPAAKMITRHGFHVISAVCEVVLLVAAGLDVWATSAWWRPDPGPHPDRSLLSSLELAGGLLVLLAATRAALIFPMCWIANRVWRMRDPVPREGAAVLWWGGIPRGAITLALGYHCFYQEAGACRFRRQVRAGFGGRCVPVSEAGFDDLTRPPASYLRSRRMYNRGNAGDVQGLCGVFCAGGCLLPTGPPTGAPADVCRVSFRGPLSTGTCSSYSNRPQHAAQGPQE